MASWQNIPQEIISAIGAKCDRKDIGICRQVCRSWSAIAQDAKVCMIRGDHNMAERVKATTAIMPYLRTVFVELDIGCYKKGVYDGFLPIILWLSKKCNNKCFVSGAFISQEFVAFFERTASSVLSQFYFSGRLLAQDEPLSEKWNIEELVVQTFEWEHLPFPLPRSLGKIHIHVCPSTREIDLRDCHPETELALYAIHVMNPLTVLGTENIRELHLSQLVFVKNLERVFAYMYPNLALIKVKYLPIKDDEFVAFVRGISRIVASSPKTLKIVLEEKKDYRMRITHRHLFQFPFEFSVPPGT